MKKRILDEIKRIFHKLLRVTIWRKKKSRLKLEELLFSLVLLSNQNAFLRLLVSSLAKSIKSGDELGEEWTTKCYNICSCLWCVCVFFLLSNELF